MGAVRVAWHCQCQSKKAFSFNLELHRLLRHVRLKGLKAPPAPPAPLSAADAAARVLCFRIHLVAVVCSGRSRVLEHICGLGLGPALVDGNAGHLFLSCAPRLKDISR